ncbi:MAG: hypothetical protein E7079_05465 [Bacteroidales bacterium]|nr:hypothetical protein [Bacteroidales bacterium]
MKNKNILRAIAGFTAFASCFTVSALTTDIYNASDLKAFRDEVNSNPSQFSGVTVRLHADINLGGETWTPIAATSGTYDNNDNGTGFVGTFDGQGYIVSNFVVNIETGGGNWFNDTHYFAVAGFFGLNKGVIKNLMVASASIKAIVKDGSMNTSGAGAIAGINGVNGVIDNCCVTNCYIYSYNGYDSATASCHANASGIANNYNASSIVKNSHVYNSTIVANTATYKLLFSTHDDIYKRAHIISGRWDRDLKEDDGFSNPINCCAINSTSQTQANGTNSTNRVDNVTYTYSSDYTSWRSGRNSAAWLNNNIPGYENTDQPYTWDEDGITPDKHYYAMISNDLAEGYRDGAVVVTPTIPSVYKRNDGIVDVYSIDYVNAAGENVRYMLYPQGTDVEIRVGLEGWDLTTLTDGKVKHAGYFVDKVYFTYDYTWDSTNYSQEEVNFSDINKPTEIEIKNVLETLSPTTNRIRRDQYFTFTTSSAPTTLLYTTINLDGQLTSANTIKINDEVKVIGNSILAPQDAEIYNINGLRVDGENLTPGIYVVRLQDSIKKVIVK